MFNYLNPNRSTRRCQSLCRAGVELGKWRCVPTVAMAFLRVCSLFEKLDFVELKTRETKIWTYVMRAKFNPSHTWPNEGKNIHIGYTSSEGKLRKTFYKNCQFLFFYKTTDVFGNFFRLWRRVQWVLTWVHNRIRTMVWCRNVRTHRLLRQGCAYSSVYVRFKVFTASRSTASCPRGVS